MSKHQSEYEEMSSSSDVIEMQGWAREYADLTAASSNFKDRVRSVARGFGVTWSRARGFYFGDARTVQAFEYKAAKAALDAERSRSQSRTLHEQLVATAQHLERVDPGFYGPAIDQIREQVSQVGLEDRSLDHAQKSRAQKQ